MMDMLAIAAGSTCGSLWSYVAAWRRALTVIPTHHMAPSKEGVPWDRPGRVPERMHVRAPEVMCGSGAVG